MAPAPARVSAIIHTLPPEAPPESQWGAPPPLAEMVPAIVTVPLAALILIAPPPVPPSFPPLSVLSPPPLPNAVGWVAKPYVAPLLRQPFPPYPPPCGWHPVGDVPGPSPPANPSPSALMSPVTTTAESPSSVMLNVTPSPWGASAVPPEAVFMALVRRSPCTSGRGLSPSYPDRSRRLIPNRPT